VILDGYSRSISLVSDSGEQFRVVYRPAPKAERDYLYWLIKQLSDDAAEFAVYEFVAKHHVESNIPNRMHNWGWKRFSLFNENYPDLFDKLFLAVQGLVVDLSGERWCDVESKWKKNLQDGIILLKTHPKIANRDCVSCEKYWYIEKTGEILRSNSTGELELRDDKAMCRTQTGCPKGTPENSRALNRSNRWALRHYMECKAIGKFPDDPIVSANAVVIEKALSAKAVLNA